MTTHKGKQEIVRIFKKDGTELNRQPERLEFAVNYLSFFGYLAVELIKNVDAETVKTAVRKFQKTFGLKSDGIVGPKTLRAMKEPRCGCPDHLDKQNDDHIQFLRVAEVISDNRDRWTKQGLTYAIERPIKCGIKPENQTRIIDSAFLAWDKVCGIHLKRISNVAQADIVISTGRGERDNFDGQGGTLAWAYMPQGNNKQLVMRFDQAETWVADPKQRGIILHNVACHEFGHTLGLAHSKKPKALMAPYYNPFVANPQQDDDIERIQKLYGPNPVVSTLKNVDQIGDELTTVSLKAGQKLLVTVN